MTWGTLWDFIGSQQFQVLASFASTIAVVIVIPLYRKLTRMIEALRRIPVIESILINHDERISELETHKKPSGNHFHGWNL